MSGYNMDPVKWEDGAPKVAMAPWCRCIKVTFSGKVEITGPNPDLDIDIYFRPYAIALCRIEERINDWIAFLLILGSFHR